MVRPAISRKPPRRSVEVRPGAQVPGGLSKAAYHRRWVRAWLFHRGLASRTELAEASGLSLAAMTAICSDLLREGLVRECDTAEPHGNGRGRRRVLLGPDLASHGILGLSYDENTVRAAALDLAGRMLWRTERPGPFASPAALLWQIRAGAAAAARAWPMPARRLLAVGASDPGLVDASAGRAVRAANVRGWADIAVAQELARALPRNLQAPALVERGDGLEALGETVFGAGRGAASILMVSWTPSGVGGGLVADGMLLKGRNGAAGEIGHLNVSATGPRCGCGLHGCLEAHIAPNRLAARWRRGAGVEAFMAAVRNGEARARTLVEQAAVLLAQAVGSAINLLNPELLVLGGLFVEAGEAVFRPLRQALPRFAIRELLDGLEVRPAELGRDAAFLGMVARVREHVFGWPRPLN